MDQTIGVGRCIVKLFGEQEVPVVDVCYGERELSDYITCMDFFDSLN